MTLQELLTYYDNLNYSEISRVLGFSKQSVFNWRVRGYIPIKSQRIIEKKTKGILVASREHTKNETTESEMTVNETTEIETTEIETIENETIDN